MDFAVKYKALVDTDHKLDDRMLDMLEDALWVKAPQSDLDWAFDRVVETCRDEKDRCGLES